MHIAKTVLAALACLLPAASARADLVTYSTTGTFDGGDQAGTSVFRDAADGISVAFLAITGNTVNVAPPPDASFANLGQFDTMGTAGATDAPVASGFRLDIFQTLPTGGAATFVGSLTGALSISNSQAFIQFNAPLTVTIGDVIYAITSADGGKAGRLNLNPPTSGAVTTLGGVISLTPATVPEPASLLIFGVGAGLVAYARRHRSRAAIA